jgi:hypothetical protein
MSETVVISSRRESILVRGRLIGMGHNTPCLLNAIRLSLPELNVSEYVKCEVLQAPSGLPDGRYEAWFEDRNMEIRKFDGLWVAGEL